MKTFIVAGAFLLASAGQAGIIASEDFQAGATGWTNNTTETPGANAGGFTRHLGRFGQGGTTSKTFALTGAQTGVTVAFDWYRLDSWDGELFRATVSDGINSFTSSNSGLFDDGGPTNIYNPSWTDRNTRISFNFATTANSLTLTFSSTLDQDLTDEAWGVDNLLITDNVTGNAVPEPATWAMMIGGFGLVGASMRRRRLSPATI